MKKENGIALIQILLVVAILSVFALYITQNARHQVQMALWSQDRAEAQVNIHSAHSQLMFSLLTEATYQSSDIETKSAIARRWNFFGQPFKLNSVVDVAIQDQSSLINLHYLNVGLFRTLLEKNGVAVERVTQIIDRLSDWQDLDTIPRPNGAENLVGGQTPRNGFIPDISEIEHILPLSLNEKKLIYHNTGIFYVGDFNPMNASLALISSLSSFDVANQYISLRKRQPVSVSQFKELTGISQEDTMRYYPSSSLAITYTATINQTKLTKEWVILLSPYAKNGSIPYNILFDRS